MTLGTLAKRGLAFHWRTNLGVMLGAAVGCAVLTGALLVGDSVRHSLRMLALARLGGAHLALSAPNRFFRAALADQLGQDLDAPAAPALRLRGVASAPDTRLRANNVQVLGVDRRFWALAEKPFQPPADHGGQVILNEALATQLGVETGDTVLLRVERPSDLPRDAPLAVTADAYMAFRLKVRRVISDREFGRFGLQANQMPPFNAFVPLEWLWKRTGPDGRVNTLLLGKSGRGAISAPEANAALRKRWELADAGIEVRELSGQKTLELRTDRVFLEMPVAEAAARALPGAVGILTYFVNELRVGDRSTPYSMVTALGPLAPVTNASPPAESLEALTTRLEPGKLTANEWLARDLQAKPGDTIQLVYYMLGPNNRLYEQTNTLVVGGIVPLQGAARDPDLMPQFPGISGAESCRDWKAGVPIESSKVRDKDETYWREHKGTPKAFVTLETGRRLWANRFGNLTAVRIPLGGRSTDEVLRGLEAEMDPATLGLFFEPAREQAIKAGAESMDFGQLFLGFSFFLIVAAILLMSLLFVFGVEQRKEEAGILLGLGFPPKRVARLFLLEGCALAIAGGLAGGAAGVLYTRGVLHGLSTLWRGAVGTSALQFHAGATSWAGGTVAGIGICVMAMWFALRKQRRATVHSLLVEDVGGPSSPSPPGPARRRLGFWIAGPSLIAALALVGMAAGSRGREAAGAFFGAGSLLLIAGIGLSHGLLGRLARRAEGATLTLRGLGERNSARRVGRSLATVSLLACGSFLVVSVGANRHDPLEGAEDRASGTGGFRFIGQASLPVFDDLGSREGRRKFGLKPEVMEGVGIVHIRVHEGDDASCLNLNRAQAPRILGVRAEELASRGAFMIPRTAGKEKRPQPWLLLNEEPADGAIPAIGDEFTVVWGLHQSAGGIVPSTDERGRRVNLRIAGIMGNSILQGHLLISERYFSQLFPSESGYRMFLVDAPAGTAARLKQTLSRAMEDVGLELTPAAERLAAFAVVENTYLSIFQLLGGLGLLLGSVGLGLVVARNILERRGELALLRAVGFSRPRLRRLVLSEHTLLLALGFGAGVVSALIAVLPALSSPGAEVPYVSLAVLLAAVVLNGLAWTWAAVVLALRGPLLPALRNE